MGFKVIGERTVNSIFQTAPVEEKTSAGVSPVVAVPTPVEPESGGKTFLQKLGDLLSFNQNMDTANSAMAIGKLFGNEGLERAGKDLAQTTQRDTADSAKEFQYIAERGAGGAAKGVEGFVNALGYLGQMQNRANQQQNAETLRAWGALTGNQNFMGAAGHMESALQENKDAGLQDTTSFGTKYQQNIQERYADEDITKAGQAVAGVSEAVGGLLPSVAANVAIPGSGLVVSALSAGGNAAQEAKASGASDSQALAYGTVVGGIEAATEKIFDGMAGIFGKGAADDVVEGIAKKLAKSETAQVAFVKIADSLGEGFEEFISEFGQRVANGLIVGADTRTLKETTEDAIASAIMGAVVGGVVQVAGGVVQGMKGDPSALAQQAADVAVNQINAETAGKAEISPATAQTDVQATPSPSEQKTAPSAVEGVEAVSSISGKGETASVIQTLNNNIPKISGASPVYTVSTQDVRVQDGRNMAQKAKDLFERIKGVVTRQGFGDVEINTRSVKDDLSHGIGPAKAAVIPSIPNIIKDGVQIDYQEKWKGRPYDGYVFAAPVTMDGETVYVAAVVLQTSKNRFYLHEVVDSNGNAIKIGSEEGANLTSLAAEGDAGTQTPLPVEVNVPQAGGIVKTETESVGAAPSGFDPYSNMISQYGIIPEGETPYRMVDLPKSTTGEDRVSYSARTVMEAQATPEAMLGDIANAVLTSELSHEVNTDAAAMERARATVEDKGWQGAKELFHQTAKKGAVSKDAVALGQLLLNNAMNSGDAKATIDILTDYASMSTTAAQSLQAQRMLKKLTPEGQLYGIQRSVNNLQEELTERYKEKAPNLEIPENLLQNLLNAQDQDARDAAATEIYKNVASQVPSTWMDKWNAWRYMAMLTNPRTHVRNIVGNLGFAPVRMVKNAVATTLEGVVGKVAPGGIDRTKAALNVASANDRALISAALKDVANVKTQLEGGGKYSDTPESKIEEYRRIFNLSALEGVRKANTAAMTAEDTLFSAPAYAGALAGYLKANGVTAEAFTSGTLNGSVLDKARSYAIKEAQKATYRDRNAFSDFISNLHYKGENKVAKAADTLVEGVLPFRRTPANILVRGVEYSPAGLVKSLTYDLYQVKQGNKTAAEAIDGISAGLTGTGLLALGAYLASLGLVSGGSTGDEEKDAMAELTGVQNYALSIDGQNFTLDWLAPEALPFFVGVELFNTMSDNSEEGVTLDDALSALERITDPMLEMSMLSGVQDLIDTVQYAESGTLVKVAANAALSYLTQAIPTLFGQIERSAEEERGTTFIDRTSGIPRDIQYTIGKAMNKLPGEYQQIPYIDAWGRTEETGTTVERILNNFLNPAYTSEEQVTRADKEINRLLDEGYTGVSPERVSQSKKVDGEYMNAEQYTEYATTKGQTSFDLVSDIILNTVYKGMTDEEKAEVIAKAYSYAGHVAAEEVTNGKHESEKYVALAQKAQRDLGLSEAEYLLYYMKYGSDVMNSDALRDAYDAGIEIETFIDYKDATKGLKADKDKNGNPIDGSKKAKVIAEISKLDIPDDAKDYLYEAAGYSASGLKDTPWH